MFIYHLLKGERVNKYWLSTVKGNKGCYCHLYRKQDKYATTTAVSFSSSFSLLLLSLKFILEILTYVNREERKLPAIVGKNIKQSIIFL